MAIRRRVRRLVFAGLILSITGLGHARPAPTLVVEGPPELAWEVRRVEEVAATDFGAVLRMTGVMGFTRPIHVLLVAESQPLARRTPAWVSGFAVGDQRTIVVFPGRVPSYPDRNLEALIHHEVAHVLVTEAAGGRSVPRWFNEGVAAVAAREWGLEDSARYALAVVGRGERTVSDLDAAFEAGGRRASRAYALSAAFVRFLESEAGGDVSARILAEIHGGAGFREAFRNATGVSLATFERRFFHDRAIWSTWVPFLTSTAALWMAITLLALWAFRRRHLRSQALHERWDAEEGFDRHRYAVPDAIDGDDEIVN
jgi:hypothetical protein